MLAFGMYGAGDFFTMKGVVEAVLKKLGLGGITEYKPGSRKYLHPGRQADVIYNGKEIAYLGEVHPVVQKNFEIGERTYIAVIDLKTVMEMPSYIVKYKGVPKFPAITRDISLSMRKDVTAGEIEEIIRKKGGKILESYELFDIYEGSQLLKGYKSLAYKIVFRASDRTLTDEEAGKVMDKIISSLAAKEVTLRQ